MSSNIEPIVPVSGISEGASLVVRLYDTHQSRLSHLSRQCDSLLSTLREHSPRLVGTSASIEADEIERAIEHILRRVSGWAKLGARAAFVKQNEIQSGIEECHRQLTACTDRFTIALSVMNTSESQMHEMTRQRDHRQLFDMMARYLDEVRTYVRLMSSQVPQQAEQQAEQLLQEQVLDVEGQPSAPPVASSSRFKLADFSEKVTIVSEHPVIKASVLDFYLGEWSEDGDHRFKEWVEALLGLQPRHVLSFFGHTTIGGIVYSVNPLMENGNIRDYIRGNLGADRVRLLSEVASGVEFLHGGGIIHGDLCGINILINGEGKAFVCGFGLSEFSNLSSDFFRARWLAPERIKSASTSPTEKADIWSFGMLCLEVFTGEDPYSSCSDVYVPVLLNNATVPEHPGPTAVGLSPKMWELMQSCWEINPEKRPPMSTIHSAIRPPRVSRQQSVPTLPPTADTTLPNEASLKPPMSSSSPALLRPPMVQIFPPTRESNLVSPTSPLETFERRTNPQRPTGNRKRSDASSLASGRLSPLFEDPPSTTISATPLSASPQLSTVPGSGKQSRPTTAPSPSPSPSLSAGSGRRFSFDSLSSRSTSSSSGSSTRRLWPFGPKRSETTPNTSPSINVDTLPPATRSSDDFSIPQPASPKRSSPSRSHTTPINVSNRMAPRPSPSASLSIILPQSCNWEPVSAAVLDLMEKVASDSECLLRPAIDGTVSSGNLEGLVSRVITGTVDSSKDEQFRAALLTIYQLFSSSECLFKILKRRFELTDLNPAHAGFPYSILLFIESWLRKGFEDEDLRCSSIIKEFALAIVGSEAMEAKAAEIARLIEDPDYVCLRQPRSGPRLRREPAERPQGVTPTELAVALTVVEGDRFKCITYWDYVNFIRRRPIPRRIEVFRTVHKLVKVWVQDTVLRPDDLGERKKVYEEWIYTAQACRNLNNLSTTSAIVVALSSPIITALVFTCESKAKQILHTLTRDITLTDEVYQGALQQAAKNLGLIPWLDRHLSSLNSTFANDNPIVVVDGHPLIDFKQCSMLAEQIDSLVQYSPPRFRHTMRQGVLEYVEYSLKSRDSENTRSSVERRAVELADVERTWNEQRERMLANGMRWSLQRRK
ncbi:hypothetical protein BJV74DRAFT_881692 [Russula compacta]|nr:hypothetical protein BJV74DRAFT_881692 [Russula compacta]